MRNPDRRSEPRSSAGLEVVLLIDDPVRRRIEGRLVDVSPSGFRVSLAGSELEAGRIVRFWIGGRSGEARVLWRRIVAGRVEYGLLIWPGTLAPEAA